MPTKPERSAYIVEHRPDCILSEELGCTCGTTAEGQILRQEAIVGRIFYTDYQDLLKQQDQYADFLPGVKLEYC